MENDNAVLETPDGYFFINKNHLESIVKEMFGKSVEEFLASYTPQDLIKVMNYQNMKDEERKKKIAYASTFKGKSEKKFNWSMFVRIIEKDNQDEEINSFTMFKDYKFNFVPSSGLWIEFDEGIVLTVDYVAYDVKGDYFFVNFKDRRIESHNINKFTSRMRQNGWE